MRTIKYLAAYAAILGLFVFGWYKVTVWAVERNIEAVKPSSEPSVLQVVEPNNHVQHAAKFDHQRELLMERDGQPLWRY